MNKIPIGKVLGESLIKHKDNELARNNGCVMFDKQIYKRRSIIENVIGGRKECRRIGTCFEKLAVSFQAMLQLAMIQRSLKIVFSDSA